MKGISDQALEFGKWNRYRYNGIEQDTTFGVDDYDAKLRDLDTQIGRWWQVDPKAESSEFLSPYASNDNDPIKLSDPNGDVAGCCDWLKAIGDGIGKALASVSGYANGTMHAITLGTYNAPYNPDAIYNQQDAEAYKTAYAFGSMAPAPAPLPGGGTIDPMMGSAPVTVPDVVTAPATASPVITPVPVMPTPMDGTANTQDRVQSNDNSNANNNSKPSEAYNRRQH